MQRVTTLYLSGTVSTIQFFSIQFSQGTETHRTQNLSIRQLNLKYGQPLAKSIIARKARFSLSAYMSKEDFEIYFNSTSSRIYSCKYTPAFSEWVNFSAIGRIYSHKGRSKIKSDCNFFASNKLLAK